MDMLRQMFFDKGPWGGNCLALNTYAIHSFSYFGKNSFHIGVPHENHISGDLSDAECLRGVNLIARG